MKEDASYKQIIEIGRALLQDASIIIMDEPTTSLTEPEIQRVFAMMRTLKEQGVGIIFISHKLGEVMEICDRYTVLRDGNMVAQGDTADDLGADSQIQTVTEGRDAMGSALVKLRAGGRVYSGNGISTDIIGASIRAYISALNKIVYEEG